jgi:hypothetical protein
VVFRPGLCQTNFSSRKLKNLESSIECLAPMEKLTEKKVIQIIVKIAEYRCPEGEEIDAIARWVKKKALMVE